MPEKEIAKRGGAIRYRTVTVGRGKNKRVLRIAVVRNSGNRGGHTAEGSPHNLKGA